MDETKGRDNKIGHHDARNVGLVFLGLVAIV